MSKSDTIDPFVQGNSCVRGRMSALKKIANERYISRRIQARKLDKRTPRKCPAVVMVWFSIALWLYGNDSYTQVFRWLRRFAHGAMPSSSALSQARAKIGVAIMADVFRQVVQCLCTNQTPNAFYCGMRLIAVDGFVLNLQDTESNRKTFGRPLNGDSVGSFPQARIVALCEVGSRVLFGFLCKPMRCGEVSMAKHLYRLLPSKSLLLFDINFCTYYLMSKAIDQDCNFLGRAKPSRCFRVQERLCDGSYLSEIYRTDHDRTKGRRGTVVRVIDYTINDPNRNGNNEKHRLVTTLLNPKKHPAKRLIELYHERWEEELAIDEIKTHLRNSPTLRSQQPKGVVAEIYSLFIAHFIVRKLAFEAACKSGVAPRRISFIGTINVLRACLPETPASRRLLKRWYEDLVLEASCNILPPRRNRINPRVIKRTQSKWPRKRDKHRKPPPLSLLFKQTVRMLT